MTLFVPLILTVSGIGGLPEQPRVEDLVRRIVGAEMESIYHDDAGGEPIPMPLNNVRRATVVLIQEEERRCTLTFDNQSRVVHETRLGIFDGPPQREVSYEYGPHGLVRRTGKSLYESEPFSWVGEYDENGSCIGSESRGEDRWRRTMRLDSESSMEILIRESKGDRAEQCTDLLHCITDDGRGFVRRHVISDGVDSYTSNYFETDAQGRVTRTESRFKMGGPVYSRTFDHAPGSMRTILWGTSGEVLGQTDVHSFGEGSWVELRRFDPREVYTDIFDDSGLIVRRCSFDRYGTARLVSTRYTRDGFGNLTECRHEVVASTEKRSYPWGYRWEIEYAETK